MELTTQNQDTLRKIKSAYESNDTSIIEKVNAIFGDPNPLTGVLLDKHNELGDTPIAEPKLYEILTQGDGIFAFAKEIEKRLKVKADEFEIMEFASFINLCKDKVTSFTDFDGMYKSTPLTENCALPNFTQLEELGGVSAVISELVIKIRNGDNSLMKDFEKAQAKRLRTVLKISSIKAKGLSDWEKQLLVEKLTVNASEVLNRMLGRSL